MADSDRDFGGSIAGVYEDLLVPLLFEPYAADLARRAASSQPTAVLEIAAGTGVVTRELAKSLPADTSIVATDLNQPMLDVAAQIGTARPVEWRQADAQALAFADATFDVAVCQFGVMFFPDKTAAFREAFRVLRPGGSFIFNVWDRIETSPFADVVASAVASMYPDDPPNFLARTPYGYWDVTTIGRDLARGGFAAQPGSELIVAPSVAESPDVPAIAFCKGTPLANEIVARSPDGLDAATAVATKAVAERFGPGRVKTTMQALVISVAR